MCNDRRSRILFVPKGEDLAGVWRRLNIVGCYSLYLPDKTCIVGRCSSVGIATELRAGRSGDRIPVGARFSAPVPTGPGAYPSSCTMGTGSFPGVKSGRGMTLTPHPLLVPWS